MRLRVQTLAFATAMVIMAGWFFHVQLMYAWMRHTGSVAPHGSNSMEWYDKPVTAITMIGHPPQLEDPGSSVPNVGVYHVLILFPGDSLTALRGTTGVS